MEQVDSVFLDRDGTLLDLRFDNHFCLEQVRMRYAEKKGVLGEDSKTHCFEQMRSIGGQLKGYSVDFWSKRAPGKRFIGASHATVKVACLLTIAYRY